MTDYPAVLRELMLAGYEGESLLSAFERMCAAIGSSMQNVQNATTKAARSLMTAADAVPADAPAQAAFTVVAPPEGAKAIARKAFMRAGLKASAMKVGSQLIEHFNLDTWRCDPGHESLAANIGCDERTVRRAIDELIGRGLFRAQRHAGRFRSNAYQVNWPLMVELAGAGDIASNRTIESAIPDNAAHQNHLKKPDSASVLRKAPRGRTPDTRQKSFVYPIDGGRASNRDAVRFKIKRQLNERMQTLDISYRQHVWEVLVEADWETAIDAELGRRGAGLPRLLAAVDGSGFCRAVG